MSTQTQTVCTPSHKANWPIFIVLALMPLAMIFQGSVAFWTEHFELARYGTVIIKDGQSAQMLGLVIASIGWATLWLLTPLVGAPRRCATCMSALAGFWTLLFYALTLA